MCPATPEQLADDLQTTYDQLWETLSLLAPEERAEPCLPSGWSPKVLLAHIAFWDDYQTRRMQAAHSGQSAQTGFSRPRQDNDRRAAADADRPWATIEAQADAARQAMIDFARSLTAEELAQEFPEGERILNLRRLLAHMGRHTRDHGQELRRYCGSLERWGRDGLRAFLIQQYTDLLDGIGRLDEKTLLTVPVCGVWSIRDVLAHVLCWEEYAWQMVQQWPEPDLDTTNARLLAAKADHTMIDLLDWLTTYQRRMLKAYDAFSNEELRSEGQYGWGAQGSLSGFFYEMALHTASHAVDIWAYRARE